MDTTASQLDGTFKDMVDRASMLDIASDDATLAFKNLKILSEIQTPDFSPKPAPAPVIVTKREKVMERASKALDNETTRVLIKAGGAFAGVALVAWATIHKDHVIDRQTMAQANQTNY